MAPYQFFFPLGIFNAFLAVGVWFTQDLNWFQTPSMLVHSKLITGGFLWNFILGFLMTAVPRMTGTAGTNRYEYCLSALLIFALMVFSWNIDPRPFYLTHALLVAFIIAFSARRIFAAQKPLPVFFSHVALAMLLALVGDAYQFYGHTYMGIHLHHIGSILLLVLGIGTRFFSFLSGLPAHFEISAGRYSRMVFHFCGFLVVALLYAAGLGFSWAYLGLSSIGLVYLFVIWKVQRRSARPSALKYSVRIVAFMVPLSFFLAWLNPAMYVTWMHLLFIGCFSLITLSVATRVILAHGSYSTDLEIKSKAFWWVVGFIVLGTLARIGYGYAGDLEWKKSFLHTAATFWIMALGTWSLSFLAKIFIPGPEAKPSC